MSKKNSVHIFENGLVLLGEEMDNCESVAFNLMFPYGSNNDPIETSGLAMLTNELSMRGAGQYSNRELADAFSDIGTELTNSVTHVHSHFGTSLLPQHLDKGLELLSDVVLRPHFPEEELKPAKQVQIQDLLSCQDDPVRLLKNELNKNFFPHPWGRNVSGTIEGISTIQMDDVRNGYEKYCQPEGAILSVAGRFDWEHLKEKTGQLFSEWKKKPIIPIVEFSVGERTTHIPFDSAQTHIGLVFPTVPNPHPDKIQSSAGIRVLGGGMSSRLFTELREKRGLCYSVQAFNISFRDFSGVFIYCGTAQERAQESLDVLIREVYRFCDEGVNRHELEITKVRAKIALILNQESKGARCFSMSSDWYYFGRIRSVEELENKLNGLTTDSINQFWKNNRPDSFYMSTLGADPLTLPVF